MTPAALSPTRLGDAMLPATRIGLGLAALGRPGYLVLGHGEDLGTDRSPDALEARTREVLDAAWAGGVRYLDAARSYGRAEAFLGRWLRDRAVDPADATVASKWGYAYTADWRVDADVHEVKDHAPAALRRQWPASRALLGAHLGLYQVHSVTPDSPALEDRDLLRELALLRAEGVRIGLSVSGPGQATTVGRALALEVDGVRLFDAVQATWNPLEPSSAPALAEAHAAGVVAVVKEALANGRLAGRAGPDALAPDLAAALARAARRLRTTPDALAIAAALARPWAGVVLSGATTVDQLRSNLRAAEVAWDDEAEASLAAFAEPPAGYWRRRAALPWT